MNPHPNSEAEFSAALEIPQIPGLSDALTELWERFLPEIRDRVAVLEAAAAAFAGHALTTARYREAHSAAHKLAGTLGTFGLSRGTDLARELEALYALDKAPDTGQGERIISIAAELRSIVESRDSNPTQGISLVRQYSVLHSRP